MKNVGNSSDGRSQEVPKVSRHPCIGRMGHCAVIFAIAQLSCWLTHRCNIVIVMCSASGTSLPHPTCSGGSRICPKRGPWPAHAHREPERGSEVPSGVQGTPHPPKLKLFVYFHTKSGQRLMI